MATLGTSFYDGTSFQFATGLWINASLTTVAPDGWYSQGGIYRYMSSGILGSPQTCASCIYSCGDPAIGWTAGGMGKMIITVDVGIASGAVISVNGQNVRDNQTLNDGDMVAAVHNDKTGGIA